MRQSIWSKHTSTYVCIPLTGIYHGDLTRGHEHRKSPRVWGQVADSDDRY